MLYSSVCSSENKIYLEFSAGESDLENRLSLGDVSASDTYFGLKGMYNLNEYISFDFSIQDYGEAKLFSDDEIYFSTSFVGVGFTGSLLLTNLISIHGHLGVARWDYDLKFPGKFDSVFRFRDDGFDIYYGTSLRYDFNENIFLV